MKRLAGFKFGIAALLAVLTVAPAASLLAGEQVADGSTPRGAVAFVASRGCKDNAEVYSTLVGKADVKLFGVTLYRPKTECKILSSFVVPQLITTAGKAFIVDGWRGAATIGNMKYHGIGTGTTAAAIGNTALETELTTQYNPDSTRATGTLVVGASSNILQSVATNTVDSSVAITEWGFLSQAATGGGTLFSRVVFSAVNLTSGDSLATTYNLTFN